MNLEPTFVDTWGWLALGHRRDAHHAQVATLFESLRSARVPIHTSDYVLDELVTLLFRRESFEEATAFVESLFAAAELGHLTVERVTSARFSAAWHLRKQFRDKPEISFTDLSSMAIMKELGLRQVVTEDDHFLQVRIAFYKLP